MSTLHTVGAAFVPLAVILLAYSLTPTRDEPLEGACPGGASSGRAGELDTSFGGAGTGIARLRFGADDGGGFFGLDMRDGGGGIVASGWGAGGLGGIFFRVARLGENGVPDPAFGEGGMVTTRWAPSTGDAAYAVAGGFQRDGRIVALGWRERFREATANIALARYQADGSLDARFGEGGKSLIDLGDEEEILDGLVLRDDRILVVGRRGGELVVARVSADGALDRSFARPRGYRAVAVGSASVARSVAIDHRGRILVAGTAEQGGQTDLVLLRLTPEGALDPSFGAGGLVTAGVPGVNERAAAVAVAPGGRVVVAGDAGAEGARDFQVRRFLANGSPDEGFGAHGVVSATTTAGDDQAEDMVALPSGAVVVVGNTVGGGSIQPLVARYTCGGALDPSFGAGGVLELDLGEYGEAHTVRVFSGDRILIGGGDVGMSPGPGTYGVVARMWM